MKLANRLLSRLMDYMVQLASPKDANRSLTHKGNGKRLQISGHKPL